MTSTAVYLVGSLLSGSILTGGFAMAWKLGRLSQKVDDLAERLTAHEARHGYTYIRPTARQRGR